MHITVDSRLEVRGHLPTFEQELVKNEPMLFNNDLSGAIHNGGEITRAITRMLPAEWQRVDLVVDSRVHMLMTGWYPCIPGWHHDDVPRTRWDGQPNYGPGQCRSEHIVALVNGGICPTEFAIGEAEFEVPGDGHVIYLDWHRDVEQTIALGKLRRVTCPSETLVRFDDRTWHRGTKATASGWRFFIRFSRYYDPDGKPISRGNPRTNEVRRQVQVYLEDPNAGW